MRRKLNQVLFDEMLAGKRFVLAVDEAQNLSESVLETVRLLSNFETHHAKLLQIVLAGPPPSETGMPQYDPVARKGYVNLQDQNIFAIIDPATDEVVRQYPVRRCKGNHGMTLAPEHHRAFLSCEENNLMAFFDLEKHESIAFAPMADGQDVTKFDPG